ncbi:hypothetical protein LBAT_0276 [Lactobacillus acetotolerans]|jgi:hypothetical protein|uniref:Uncharacterized protein n=1 Tax=Lactobacillus acetotolerans TaxID=1600 RepID=A0A0D6A2C9_9LACO|nr:hypothetical protein [Lactobacillus acetotolerans]QJD72612.1 hypothetical protein HG715_00990 [Lactobacillus acetotolerans]BAQ56665.1 hypothetical protein LBAT_0276 [Lactobacillus acetotolerans]
MIKKDINIAITSPQEHAAVAALIDMNNAVGYATHVEEANQDAVFIDTVKKAHYYATQTEIDLDNIDAELHNVLAILLHRG